MALHPCLYLISLTFIYGTTATKKFPRKIMYSLFKDIRGAFENVGEKHKELFFEEFQKF